MLPIGSMDCTSCIPEINSDASKVNETKYGIRTVSSKKTRAYDDVTCGIMACKILKKINGLAT